MSVVIVISGPSFGTCPVIKKVRKLHETHLLMLQRKLECGPIPNVMVALPNIGGALCSVQQSLADSHYLTAMQ